MKEFNFTVPETTIRNLITVYAGHKLVCEKYETDDTEYNADYDYHLGNCYAAETWMRALGISPDSNYVYDIYEMEKASREASY